MNKIIIILLLLIITIVIIFYALKSYNLIEGYNDQTGQFAITCDGKSINQCLGKFNCGWCVDADGNSGCIGGDLHGPWNYEKCMKWTHGDPFSYMLQTNPNNKC